MGLNELLTELVDSHIASSKIESLRSALLEKCPSGVHAFRVGEFNVQVGFRPVSGSYAVCREVLITKAKEIAPKGSPFIPKVGEYFRVEHKSTDRSYRAVVWECVADDQGVVLGRELRGTCKGVVFNLSEWNFFSALRIASYLKSKERADRIGADRY